MKKFSMLLVALIATAMCVTFTSCNKDEVKQTISGYYLLLNTYDVFEMVYFKNDGSVTSMGFYGNKSGKETAQWSEVKGHYVIDGGRIEIIYEDGDNSKGKFLLNDREFVISDEIENETYVYKRLSENNVKTLTGRWSSTNLCILNDPKKEFINIPGFEPFPTAELDFSMINSIVNIVFKDITFKENGEFTFKFNYGQEEKGTYARIDELRFTMTMSVKGVPVDITGYFAQTMDKSESYFFFNKDDALKFSLLYLYQRLEENGISVTDEQLSPFYKELTECFSNFAFAISLQDK